MRTVSVVLAGGVGTRLYPASTAENPKQFRSFGGDRSLLARAVDRASFADETYVLTRPAFADAVREHAPSAAVLTEPEPKDTGPALVYAAHRVRKQVGDCVLCCLPSDHHVSGDFASVARRACAVAAETGGLVTLGVEPTRAATEYGYVKPGEDHGDYSRAEAFREKPDPGAAARYCEHGYLWNAGVFAWTPDALLSEARESPLAGLVDALDAGDPGRGFREAPAVSVDHAVMEGAEDVFVVPADFEWDDLGSWDALRRVLDADAAGNAALGETLAVDADECVLAAGEGHHVSAVGVSDLAVAAYDGRVLVVPTSEAQRVREVVDALE